MSEQPITTPVETPVETPIKRTRNRSKSVIAPANKQALELANQLMELATNKALTDIKTTLGLL